MATVIRRESQVESPAGDASRPPTFTFSDMRSQGDEYIQAVRAEAAKVVQEANAEAEAIRQRAEEAGEAAARESIERLLNERLGEQLTTLRPALDGVVTRLDQAHGAWLEHWEQSGVRLAVAIAERIVRRELAAEPEITLTWVREALELAAGSSEITVRLHPTDCERLESQVAVLSESMSRIGETRVVPDETVSPGGCRVDTKHGSVDLQLETQLARLAEELA